MFDVVLTVKYMYRTRKGRVCSTDFRTEKKKGKRSCQYIKQVCIKEFDGILMFFLPETCKHRVICPERR